MRSLRILLVGLAAMMLFVGGAARALVPLGASPACHAMAGQQHTPSHESPHSDMVAMNCCAACLSMPESRVLLRLPTRHGPEPVFALGTKPLEGRSLPPELGPPRLS